ncbi:MAG TPA: isoprenylcysteine carboxylmethyltransferase family protein [Actinomycetota bacterium]|nr:isoprenylcysteine carboxylmethyltransferase family protein [Actinomycetota bacterium]
MVVAGLVLNIAFPALFTVGGPADALRAISIVMLIVGVTIWIWSVVLILRHVPRGELITTGPFRLVRHPLYTGVSLLVLPWLGFLLNSWLGLVIGLGLAIGLALYPHGCDDASPTRLADDPNQALVTFPGCLGCRARTPQRG